MSDEKALLAAIRDHPDEDTPRLMLADWLQDNGQPERAEFIRVQVEASRLRWNDPRWKSLAEQAKKLFEAHGEEWIGPLGWLSPGGKTEVRVTETSADGWGGGVELNWVDSQPNDMGDVRPGYESCIEFHRGFPRRVYLTPFTLVQAPAAMGTWPRPALTLSWEPHTRDREWVRKLWPDVVRGLRSSQFSDWIFNTSYSYEFDWMPLLAAVPDVARGTSGLLIVGAGDSGRPESDLTNLFPLAPSLRYLSLYRCGWSLDVLRHLGRCVLPRTLEYLALEHDHPAAAVLRAMAEVGDWPNLLSLTLSGLEGARKDALDVIRPGMLPNLRLLTFWGEGGTVPFFSALLACPQLSHVERIEYHGRSNAAMRKLRDKSGGRFVCK